MIKGIFGIATCVGVIWLLFWVFIGVSIFEVGSDAVNDVTTTKTEMQNHLRDRLVVNGDTLTITDYNYDPITSSGTYTLSDGKPIGREKAEKLIIQ